MVMHRVVKPGRSLRCSYEMESEWNPPAARDIFSISAPNPGFLHKVNAIANLDFAFSDGTISAHANGVELVILSQPRRFATSMATPA